jgi:hypothetical protein
MDSSDIIVYDILTIIIIRILLWIVVVIRRLAWYERKVQPLCWSYYRSVSASDLYNNWSSEWLFLRVHVVVSVWELIRIGLFEWRNCRIFCWIHRVVWRLELFFHWMTGLYNITTELVGVCRWHSKGASQTHSVRTSLHLIFVVHLFWWTVFGFVWGEFASDQIYTSSWLNDSQSEHHNLSTDMTQWLWCLQVA